MTNWNNLTTFEEILAEANHYAPFWSGVLLMIWAIFLITFIPFGISIALLSASFVSLILGLMLAYMGLVSWKLILIFVSLIIFQVIVSGLHGKKE